MMDPWKIRFIKNRSMNGGSLWEKLLGKYTVRPMNPITYGKIGPLKFI